MKVRLVMQMSGSRMDGTPWPPVGAEIDVPDWEGAQLCESGRAIPVAEPETRAETPEDTLGTRTETRAGKASAKASAPRTK